MRRSPVTVAKAYRLLHAILTTAEDDRLIRRNPCRIDNAGKEDSPEREIVPLPVVFAIAKAVPVRYRALAALGRVLGLDRAPEVKTIRRKLGELAAAGKAADLIMALARRHAAARPDALGFLYVDGHARAYYGTRNVQKTHIARLKFPAPATEETWVTEPGRRARVHGGRRAVGLAGRRAAPAAARSCAPVVGRGPAGDGVLRPGRLVPGPVRRHHRGRVRPARPGARARPPTCPPTSSPPSPAPMTGAGSTSTTWPTPRSR